MNDGILIDVKRVQIQFTEEQLSRLRHQAAAEEISISSLVRRAVDEMTARGTADQRDEQWSRALAATGAFAGDGAPAARDHDEYLPEAFGSP